LRNGGRLGNIGVGLRKRLIEHVCGLYIQVSPSRYMQARRNRFGETANGNRSAVGLPNAPHCYCAVLAQTAFRKQRINHSVALARVRILQVGPAIVKLFGQGIDLV